LRVQLGQFLLIYIPMASAEPVPSQVADLARDVEALRAEIGRVIVGHDEVVDGVLTAVLGSGHALLEGVPGLGKTMLVRTLAEALDLVFSRIQFTPDLMPADIIGTNVLGEDAGGQKRFQFQRGPVFANIVLADEVNRATPKTQSALLEAMQEHSVTVGKNTYALDPPFFVLATQNPLEMEGTYPLPEAQLDRFMVKLKVTFPTREALHTILERTTGTAVTQVKKVMSGQRLLQLQQMVRQVPCARPVQDFAVRVLQATHPESAKVPALTKKYVRYGASPRGAQACLLSAKIRAVLAGRFAVASSDIRASAKPTMRHRIILNFEGEAEGIDPDQIIDGILNEVPELI
jgi:MoxR-like ATPase